MISKNSTDESTNRALLSLSRLVRPLTVRNRSCCWVTTVEEAGKSDPLAPCRHPGGDKPALALDEDETVEPQLTLPPYSKHLQKYCSWRIPANT